MKCVITLFPRLHMTLIGMGLSGYRRNGGVGFCIDSPFAKIEVCRSPKWVVEDVRSCPLQSFEMSNLLKVAQRYTPYAYSINIAGDMASHVGFGSGTGIRLAVLEGIFRLENVATTTSALVSASGRGATSGIGIHTYFSGGLIIDLGVHNNANSFLPSSHAEDSAGTPLLLKRVAMPSWDMGICIPQGIASKTAQEELEFFANTARLSQPEIHEAMYHVISGVVASAMEGSSELFCEAVRSIQKCTWKLKERKLYGLPLASLEESIYEAGAKAVGMSSLGPCLYFLADDVHNIVAKLSKTHPSDQWYTAAPRNIGRHVQLQ